MRMESVAEIPTEAEPACKHHWVIASPSGQESLGTCKLCPATRMFQNYMPREPWEEFYHDKKGTQPLIDQRGYDNYHNDYDA